MGKFINPFTDMGFKMIFGQEVNKSLLIDFLNNLLKGERVIKDVQFLDKEQLPSMENERGLIYDVYCRTDTGARIVIEMQTAGSSTSRTGRCSTSHAPSWSRAGVGHPAGATRSTRSMGCSS